MALVNVVWHAGLIVLTLYIGRKQRSASPCTDLPLPAYDAHTSYYVTEFWKFTHTVMPDPA